MGADGTFTSLQDLIDATPDFAAYLYNDTPGPHSRARAGLTPVPAEFSNWRDEQRAWRESAILFDQSHHMPELYLTGPDAFRLLNRIGVNSLANLSPGRAKQFIGCNLRGQMIGDCILYDLGDQAYELVSSMPLLNWVECQAQAGDWDVTIERDNNTSDNPSGQRDLRRGHRGRHPRHQVLPHGAGHHRRHRGPRTPARDGRAQGGGDLRALPAR